MSQLILLAITLSEWQSVSDAHSDKDSNVTQMLYSSSQARLTQKAKQTSSTATFNHMWPWWRPFLTSKGTSALELSLSKFAWMMDTFLSNGVSHIASIAILKKGNYIKSILDHSHGDRANIVISRVHIVQSQNNPDWKVINIQTEFEWFAGADSYWEVTIRRYSRAPNQHPLQKHLYILCMSHFARRGSAVKM